MKLTYRLLRRDSLLLLGASRLTEDGSLANGALYLDESGAQMLDKYRRVWPIEQSYAQGLWGEISRRGLAVRVC